MNIGVVGGIPASIAGSPLAQTSGSDVDRTKTATAAQSRAHASAILADKAAGIGETDGKDHQTEDRDADGRRPWEFGPPAVGAELHAECDAAERQSRDASGASGSQLDVSG